MRYIRINDLSAGMVIGRDIINTFNEQAAAKGDVLNEERIRQLKKEGYQGVFIEDALSASVKPEDSLYAAKYVCGKDLVKEGDIEGLCRISAEIVDDIMSLQPERMSIQKVQSYKDYLFYHTVNVAIYSAFIGHAIGLDREGLYLLSQAAILRDIGLAKVPEYIFYLLREQSAEEKEKVHSHVSDSVEILEKAGLDELVIEAVAAHHENENGSGYPAGMRSSKIPDFAKIIHVANELDAMTTKRPAKTEYSVSDALDYLSDGAGIIFHKAIVNILLKKFDAYAEGDTITLYDGRKAVVTGRSTTGVRPVVILEETGESVNLNDDPDYMYVSIKSSFAENNENAQAQDAEQETVFRKNIVVVDDDFISRKTAIAALEGRYEVTCFDNATSAITHIRRQQPDLIVMDIEMPGMDGITAVKTLRNEGFTDIPVIFLTSVNSKQTVMDCIDAGAADYILKPSTQIYIYERASEALRP